VDIPAAPSQLRQHEPSSGYANASINTAIFARHFYSTLADEGSGDRAGCNDCGEYPAAHKKRPRRQDAPPGLANLIAVRRMLSAFAFGQSSRRLFGRGLSTAGLAQRAAVRLFRAARRPLNLIV
jgi:hypothetical protein